MPEKQTLRKNSLDAEAPYSNPAPRAAHLLTPHPTHACMMTHHVNLYTCMQEGKIYASIVLVVVPLGRVKETLARMVTANFGTSNCSATTTTTATNAMTLAVHGI